MALREIMRVPTDKLSMMAASEEGQRGPSVKTEQDRDQPKQEGDQPEAARDQPEAAAGDAAAGDQEEADDTMDNDGGGQDFKLEDVEAMDGGRVATKLPFTQLCKILIYTKFICDDWRKMFSKFILIYRSLFSLKFGEKPPILYDSFRMMLRIRILCF
jgi:hypothetical protein